MNANAIFPAARNLIRVMRPFQWVKNLPCLAPLIFSGLLFVPAFQGRALLAWLAFSLLASALYIVNDWNDRERDRASPRTAQRPLAAGTLSAPLALAAALLLLIAAFALAAALNHACLAILALQAGLNLAYTFRLKRTVIVDVICIALGFVNRVVFGAFALAVAPSAWIILCMFFLALLLGFGKRRGEIVQRGEASASARAVLGKYSTAYLDLTIAVMATLTIQTYALYTVAAGRDPTLTLSVIPVVYCVLRYAYKLLVEGHGEVPEDTLLGDPMLWLGILAWLVICLLAVYAPTLLDPPAPGAQVRTACRLVYSMNN